ncbi:MAG: hypothetical protein QM729_08855 [Solirubrobacterales bacterium]
MPSGSRNIAMRMSRIGRTSTSTGAAAARRAATVSSKSATSKVT